MRPKSSKRQRKARFLLTLSTVVIFVAIFQTFSFLQSQNVKEFKKFDKEFRTQQIETKKVIEAGVENFTPNSQEIEWPGCTFPLNRKLTTYEMGYCDGAFLSFAWEGSAMYESEDVPQVILEYQNFADSEGNPAKVCEIATSSSSWKNVLYNHPKYIVDGINLESNPKLRSAYVSGCKLGIEKSFKLGAQEYTKWKERNAKREIKDNLVTASPLPSKSLGKGRWVSKCRFAYVPNPNYVGDQNGVAQNLAAPRYITERQCTDVYVLN